MTFMNICGRHQLIKFGKQNQHGDKSVIALSVFPGLNLIILALISINQVKTS